MANTCEIDSVRWVFQQGERLTSVRRWPGALKREIFFTEHLGISTGLAWRRRYSIWATTEESGAQNLLAFGGSFWHPFVGPSRGPREVELDLIRTISSLTTVILKGWKSEKRWIFFMWSDLTSSGLRGGTGGCLWLAVRWWGGCSLWCHQHNKAMLDGKLLHQIGHKIYLTNFPTGKGESYSTPRWWLKEASSCSL